jgi:uncharacterized protein
VRVLFDTNVLYSAFTAKGVCEDIVDSAAGVCTIIWSQPLQHELETALKRKFKLGPNTQDALAVFSELCEFAPPVALPKPICRDADDDVVLATAVAGRAAYIVTGDEDLLVLKKYQGIRILSPRQFLALFPI